ncbi:MAG TPA: sugar ABC transporter permease [Thermomicrobiales bacterium]|jgi:multiple sugar transport system permease protein|nr:sugar ABC transporter permease [Thermomicrobiales bacterium]
MHRQQDALADGKSQMIVDTGPARRAWAPPRLSRQARRDIEGWLFILPVAIGVLAFYVGPILVSLYTSFTNSDGLTKRDWVGLFNYDRLLTRDAAFRETLLHTLYYVAGHIPLTMGLALALALLCHRQMPGVTLFRTAYFLPVVTNVVAISLVWSFFFAPDRGPLNWLIGAFGADGPSWLSSTTWAMPAIIIVSVWFGVGYPMVILLAGLQGIPEVYYEAAKVDGASAWWRFRAITIPLLTPTLFFLTITQFISSFQVFGIIYVMTSGGPANSTEVYIHQLYKHAFQFSRMGYASAMAWILFLIIGVISVLQWKLQKYWVHYD